MEVHPGKQKGMVIGGYERVGDSKVVRMLECPL